MKNSLFKRAIAAAAAVPLALTQCLTYANAVSTDTINATANVQAGEEALTLENLLYIPVEETVSKWNQTVTSSLDAIENREGTLDITPYVDDIVKNAGDFGEVAEVILTKCIIPNGVTYEITGSNDIVIKGKISSPKQYNSYKNSPGEALDKVGKKYGAADIIHKTYFDSVDCSGDVTITIKASQLAKGTKVPVSFEFKTADGSYGIAQLPEWAKTKLGEIQKVADAAIKENVAADKADAAVAEYDAEIKKLTDKLDKATKNINDALAKSDAQTFGNLSEGIAYVNSYLAGKGVDRKIPESGAAIAAKEIVAKACDNGIKKIAPNGEIAITAAELGGFADSVKDINATLSSGVLTGLGTFEDAEKDAVIAYYADGSKGFTVKDSYKKITATVDYSGAKTVDAGSVDVQIERVLVTETTTTTTTTAPIDTTTTTTQPIDTTTTTDNGETTTTTTDGDTTTTTTTVPDVTTTTTTTTTAPIDTTTTTTQPIDTTTTTDNGETTTTTTDGDTTTTTTTVPDVTTTTTTTEVVVTSIVSKYVECEVQPAFYLSIDEAFDKTQVSDIKLHVFYDKTTTKGDVTTTEKGLEEISFLSSDNVSFGDATPSNTYKKDNATFKYEIPVLFNGEKIADKEGKDVTATAYIGVKGDTNLDSSVTSVDASQVLRYYALVQTGSDKKDVQLSGSKLVDGPTSIYDEFAAFLSDVQTADKEGITRYTQKADRTLNAVDASRILSFYAKRQTSDNDGKTDKELWDEVDKKIVTVDEVA
ncbi:hypothetical protein [Ruminococcus sp.]|uniref:hypothetical protein n=1 Tax=Ruminococcus sp. TaxID=41978 RepID=UPI002BD8C19F|nr:hypothetical protein [Ruminococcus sp.]HNZ99037.1 hypothetical protein [Ruminococcus sp.]